MEIHGPQGGELCEGKDRDWGQSDMPTSQRVPTEAGAGPGADSPADSPEGTDPAHTLILDSWPQELRRLSVNFCHFQSPVCGTRHSSHRKLTQVLGCAGVWIPSSPPHPPASCELGAFGRWGVGEYHTLPKNMVALWLDVTPLPQGHLSLTIISHPEPS